MSTIDLLEPLFADGIAAPNYFNGRVLSAEDLLQATDAGQQVDRLLGRAIGEGVVEGLEVTAAAPSEGVPAVRIEAGIAINRRGAVARLPAWQILRLGVTTPVRAGKPGFADCDEVAGPAWAGDPGVYLLTIGPVRGNRGLAPALGLGNVAAACNVREVVAGVQFRLAPLSIAGLDAVPEARRRSAVAARCLGIEELLALKGVAAGAAIAAYGAIDDLRRAGALTDCEVPLATIRIADGQVAFVDRWSARRRPARPAAERRWPHLVGDRRLAEAEALFLQFQDQLLDIAPTGTDATRIQAGEHFDWLPPAGILPRGTGRFIPARFFRAQTLAPVAADHALARQVIHDSFYREPFRADDDEVQLQVLEFEDHPEYVIFNRVERVRAAPPVVAPEPGPGGFDIDVTWAGDVDPAITEVWAQDAAGKRYPASLDPLLLTAALSIFGRRDVQRFRVRGLPPGAYWVKARSKAYPIASVPATAIAKSSVLVTVRLRPGLEPCPPRFRLEQPVDKLVFAPDDRIVDNGGAHYGGAAVMHQYLAPASELPKRAIRAPRMQLSETVRDRIGDLWRCRLELDPDWPVATWIDPEIWIDPTFDPKVFPPPPDPYAWMRTGDVIYPLILLAQERTLPSSVPATKAGIPGLDVEAYATVLEPMGLGDMDVLAGAWTNLLGETLDIAPEATRAFSQQLVAKTEQALANKQYYPGMTPEVGEKVAASGDALLTDDVAIANASPGEVATRLREVAGDALTEAEATLVATRMVTTARGFLPKAAWSLEDPALPLTDELRGALAQQDIQTKGQLAAAPEATRTAVADVAGAPVAAIDAAATTGEVLVAAHRDAAAPEQSLTELNLSEAQASRLIEAGITSPTELATADVDLTATLGIDATEANALKTEAAGVAATRWSGLQGAVAGAGGVSPALNRATTGATIGSGIRLVGGIQ